MSVLVMSSLQTSMNTDARRNLEVREPEPVGPLNGIKLMSGLGYSRRNIHDKYIALFE